MCRGSTPLSTRNGSSSARIRNSMNLIGCEPCHGKLKRAALPKTLGDIDKHARTMEPHLDEAWENSKMQVDQHLGSLNRDSCRVDLLRLDEHHRWRRKLNFQSSPRRPHHTGISRLCIVSASPLFVNLCKIVPASVAALAVRPIGIRCHPLSVHCIKICAEADQLVNP
jgi:hypothetical protein